MSNAVQSLCLGWDTETFKFKDTLPEHLSDFEISAESAVWYFGMDVTHLGSSSLQSYLLMSPLSSPASFLGPKWFLFPKHSLALMVFTFPPMRSLLPGHPSCFLPWLTPTQTWHLQGTLWNIRTWVSTPHRPGFPCLNPTSYCGSVGTAPLSVFPVSRTVTKGQSSHFSNKWAHE